jgi:hypothetical protein
MIGKIDSVELKGVIIDALSFPLEIGNWNIGLINENCNNTWHTP